MRKRWLGWLAALVLASTAAQAADPIPADVVQRFKRASRLFTQGNHEQALLEFERVYAATGRTQVLFNIAVVQAELKRPVDCLATVAKVQASPGNLLPERLKALDALAAKQHELVGEVSVQSPVDGVEVVIGGKSVGKTPLTAPVLVPTGRVLVAGQAQKRKPGYVETQVAPKARVDVHLDLLPLDVQYGTVTVKTALPGADVFVDNVRVGTTPLVTRFPVEPGDRTVELRRDGYTTASKRVAIGEASQVEVALEPAEEPMALGQKGATVKAELSETQVVVTVDGKVLGVYRGALRLLPGPHRITFERGGFFPVTKDVDLLPNDEVTLAIRFEPTAEFRADVEQRQKTHRLLGIGGLALGAAGVAFGVGYTVYVGGEVKYWQGKATEWDALSRTKDAATACGPSHCGDMARSAQQQGQSVQGLALIGYLSLGAGAAVAAAGLVALLTAPSLDRYDLAPSDALAPELSLWPTPDGLRVALSARF